jgi:F0F1-type ATP synthase alpha subunit
MDFQKQLEKIEEYGVVDQVSHPIATIVGLPNAHLHEVVLLESDVGEGIFFAGLKHVAIKVIASYTEDQIITSDPSQILAIKKAKQELDNLGN